MHKISSVSACVLLLLALDPGPASNHSGCHAWRLQQPTFASLHRKASTSRAIGRIGRQGHPPLGNLLRARSGKAVLGKWNPQKPLLGRRLKAVYSLIPQRNGSCRVADIGSGHSVLSLELARLGADTVIAVEKSEAELIEGVEKTDFSFSHEAELFENGVQFRLGDGLSALEPGEVDTVCIAGIHARGILNILSPSEGIDTLRELRVSSLVLQAPDARPKHLANLRHWLHHHGWRIENEILVSSQGRYFITIKAQDAALTSSKTVDHHLRRKLLLPTPITERILQEHEASEWELYKKYLNFHLAWARTLASKELSLEGRDGWAWAEHQDEGRVNGQFLVRDISPKVIAEELENELELFEPSPKVSSC